MTVVLSPGSCRAESTTIILSVFTLRASPATSTIRTMNSFSTVASNKNVTPTFPSAAEPVSRSRGCVEYLVYTEQWFIMIEVQLLPDPGHLAIQYSMSELTKHQAWCIHLHLLDTRWSFVLTGPILWHNSIEWDWTSCQQKIFDLFWQNYFRNSSLAWFVCSLVCFLTSAGSQVLSHIITNVFSNVSTHAANCVQTFSTIVTSSESNSPLTNSYILNTSSCGNIHLQTVYLPTLIIETVENDHYQDRKWGTF